jgi:hypothetical protein
VPHDVLGETKEYRNNGCGCNKVMGSKFVEIREFEGWRMGLVLEHNGLPCETTRCQRGTLGKKLIKGYSINSTLAKPHGVVDKHTTSKKIACLILGNRPTSRYLIHKLISQSPNIPISTTLIVNKCMPKLFQKGIPLLRIG